MAAGGTAAFFIILNSRWSKCNEERINHNEKTGFNGFWFRDLNGFGFLCASRARV